MITSVNINSDEMELYLKKFRRRIKWRDGWILAQRTLFLPSLTAMILQSVGRFIPVERLGLWTLLPFAIWLLVVILYGTLKPLSLLKTALHADIELGLKERLSTAFEIASISKPAQARYPQGQPQKPARMHQQLHQAALDEQIILAQLQDARRVASTIQPAKAFPLYLLHKPLFFGIAFILICAALVVIPNPQTLILQQRAAIKQAAQEQAQKIEQLKEEIETQELSPEIQEELLRRLEELAQALKQNPGDLEQAMADLSRFEEQIKQRIDPNLAAKENLLQSLSNALSQTKGTNNIQNTDQLTEQALEQLIDSLGTLDQAQREQLSKELAKLSAQATQTGSTSLAQALSSLAQTIQSGDAQSVRDGSQELKEILETTRAQISDQRTLQNALAQSLLSQQTLAQLSRQVAQMSGQSSQTGAGSQASPGQSASPVVSGGGSRANQLPPAVGGRSQVRPRGNAPEVPATKLESQVYAPWQRSPGSDQQLFSPGQNSNQGETSVSESQNPNAGISNPALVPYSQVYYNYLNVANQAMDQGEVPGYLQDYVREYFSSLEP